MLLRRDAGLYAESHPSPEDVLLLIEVADSSAIRASWLAARTVGRFKRAEPWFRRLPGKLAGWTKARAAPAIQQCWWPTRAWRKVTSAGPRAIRKSRT